MGETLSFVLLFVVLLIVSLLWGFRIFFAAFISGSFAYLLSFIIKSFIIGDLLKTSTSFPSISVSISVAIGYWIFFGNKDKTKIRIIAYALFVGLIIFQRLIVSAHELIDIVGGIIIGAISIIVCKHLFYRVLTTKISVNQSTDEWPTRSYIPPGIISRWSRSEVAERYPDVVSPLFSDFFFPVVGRAVQRITRFLGIKKQDVCIGYSVSRGYALSNMGPWVLNIFGVLRCFVRIRKSFLEYFNHDYNIACEKFWTKAKKLERCVEDNKNLEISKLYLSLIDAVALAEEWMGEQTLSLFYITFGHYYLRLMLLLHFPWSHKSLLHLLPQGVKTRSYKENELLFQLGKLISESKNSWKDFSDNEKFIANQLLDQYGDKSSAYDFLSIRWNENPELIIDLAKSIAKEDSNKQEEFIKLKENRQEAETRIKNHFRKLHFICGKKLGQELIKINYDLYVYKEERQFQMAKAWGLIKNILFTIADKLIDLDFMKNREDILFLSSIELDSLMHQISDKWNISVNMISKLDIQSISHVRRNEFYQCNAMPCQEEEGGNVLEFKKSRKRKLKGRYSLPGRVTAKAVIIRRLDEFHRLQKGQILVAKMTNPNWDILFKFAGGIIIEKGGALSHPLLKASEYGIPALVGVDNATNLINDGDLVLLDGDSNSFKVIKDEKYISN